MSRGAYVQFYDFATHEVIKDCPLKPSNVTGDESPWLWAENDKYDDEGVYLSKIGKWMIFAKTSDVDELWEKVKYGIKMGILWHAKVATVKPEYPGVQVIIVYTKDYDDIQDVVNVLDYLEKEGIKPPNREIKYKTDNQTYAGVYAGGKQRPSIYSSNNVRSLLRKPQ